MSLPRTPSDAGLIIMDCFGGVVYSSAEADHILSYPCRNQQKSASAVRQILQRLSVRANNFPMHFISGNRQYLVRHFELKDQHGVRRGIAILMERPKMGGHKMVTGSAATYGLTNRESEVLNFLTGGLTTKEIAARLRLSPNTVKGFLRTLMLKTGATTRTGVVSKVLAQSNSL